MAAPLLGGTEHCPVFSTHRYVPRRDFGTAAAYRNTRAACAARDQDLRLPMPLHSQTLQSVRLSGSLAAALLWLLAAPASAQRIENQTAVFAALDKVTARISRLEIKLGETVRFGALKVTPKLCYSRPPDQPPKTSTFVEVLESQLDGSEKKLFSGWMFAESPGLGAVEHPVYDVWLTECLQPKAPPGRPPAAAASAPAAKGAPGAAPAAAGPAPAPGEDEFRRRRPPR
jgi:hypothetical protein